MGELAARASTRTRSSASTSWCKPACRATRSACELALRACRALRDRGRGRAGEVPARDRRPAAREGVELRADRELLRRSRRRVKNEAELAGIRRAQRAAEAGMAAARDLLRRARARHGILAVDGEPLTSERVKQAIERVSSRSTSCIGRRVHRLARRAGGDRPRHGRRADRAGRAGGHRHLAARPRVGLLRRHDPHLRRRRRRRTSSSSGTGCLRGARARDRGDARRASPDSDVNDASATSSSRPGYPTQRTKPPGSGSRTASTTGSATGSASRCTRQPKLGLVGQDELVAGDVITVEPGLYRQGFGGVRLEDLVLVTDDGGENLTDFPYDLTP